MNRNDLPVHVGPDQSSDLHPEPFRGGGSQGFRDGQTSQLGVDWRRIRLALIRQLPLIVLVTVLGTAAGFGLSRMIDPEYSAEARLIVRSTGGAGGGQGGPIEAGATFRQTSWLDLLESFQVLDRVAENQRLFLGYLQPADSIYFRDFSIRDEVVGGTMIVSVSEDGESYVLLDEDEQVIEEGRVGGRIGIYRGLLWQPPALPPGRDIVFWVSTVRDAAAQLRGSLNSGMDAGASFIRIWLTGTNPSRVANTVNGVAESLVQEADNQKIANVAGSRERLLTQLDSARTRLQNANAQLESFLVDNAGTATDPTAFGGQGGNAGSVTQLRQRMNDLNRQIDNIEAARDSGRESGDYVVDAFESIPAVQQSSTMMGLLRDLTARQDSLRTLLLTYTESHADVIDVEDEIEQLQQAIPAQATQLVIVLDRQVTEIEDQIADQTSELRDVPLRARQEQELRSAVTTAQQIFDDIQQAYQQATLAEATLNPDLSILDYATVPTRPVSNTTVQLLAMAIVGSLALAIFGALFLDRIDNRIRYPDQVTYNLGLNILGAVPRGRRRSGGKFKNSNEVLEAFRSLRLNLIHAHNQPGPLVLTLTSPDPGDGKSFVTSNLAWVFASLGQRTLVIDGDTRRGTLHRLLEVERKPGLTDYLSGRVSADELIVPSQKQNVHVIPSGARIGHSPELLSSNAMVRLVNDMRDRYQVILIDSPPLRAGVDPLALATITENLLIVLRSGVSDKEIVETKLQLLDQLPVRVLGAVLNSLAPRGHGYKQYTYLSDYGVDGEEAEETEILPPLPVR